MVGPRALIVGNSDGIGLALTRRLLAAGWAVTGLSRSGSGIRDEQYRHVVTDVTAEDFPRRLGAAVDGGIELCVYAAGIGEFLDLEDLATQTRVLDVNLMGLARTVEAVVPWMLGAGRGHLVGLSSLADVGVSAQAPAYSASKAGMSAYLLGLAPALRPHGVRVTTVRFGFVDTKMAKSPVTPGMVPVERAVDVLMRALRTRPAVVSYPRHISVAARALSVVPALRRIVSG